MTRSIVVIRFAVVASFLFMAAGATANDWVVATNLDLPDTNPGDGFCVTSQGQCGLRAAIEESNALGGSHTVTLPANIFLLTHTQGSVIVGIKVTADVEVYGAGLVSTAIDGNSATQIFRVESGARLRLESLIVRNGRDEFNVGGCITNDATLEMYSVFISGCVDAIGGGGGAIANFGSFTGTFVIFFDNRSGSAALGGAGGGLDNRPGATTSLFKSTFIENTAGRLGGGIFNQGILTLEDSTLRDGEAESFNGGGLFNVGTAVVERVTVSGNHAGGLGGGIDQEDGADLTMINCTVSGNSAGSAGGGLTVEGSSTTSLTHVTFADNTDSGTAAAINHAWGPTTTVELVNTLISSGGATNCSSTVPFISLGHNLEDLDTCGLGATGDLVNTVPLLGPLQDNGGQTHTVALLVGSPGVDDGDGTLGISADQRGVARPYDGDGNGISEVDIGAFELTGPIFIDGFESGDTSAWSNTAP